MKRIVSIDVLRGFSLMMMIIIHFMIAYGNAQAAESLLYFILDHLMGTWLLVCWPLWIIYFLTGRFLGQDAMGVLPAFLLGLAGVALFLVGLRAWDRRGGKYSLEWGLRKITEGTGKPGRTS